MPLRGGLQIVVQAPDSSGTHRHCTGFVHAPVDASVYVAIVPAHPADGRATQIAERLGHDLRRAIASLSAATTEQAPPCGGANLGSCHALGVPECQKVLVPVFVDPASAGSYLVPQEWANATNATIVPVVGDALDPKALPPQLGKLNAIRWTPADQEPVLRLLRIAQIANDRPRIFISYVRAESQALADQLFDHLGRRGFDVFLDRFSIAPGREIATKLREELSRMGTVLVLETAGINRSAWTRGEVDFARMHRLGLCALRLPRGRAVAGVGKGARRDLAPGDFGRSGRLARKALRDVLAWIEATHLRADLRRREYLRAMMSDALTRHGIHTQTPLRPGLLIGQNARGRRFAIRISSLPAELDDFHLVGGHAAPVADLFVVAPGRYVDWRRRVPLDWLERVSRIQMRDEGELDQLAKDLA